MKPRPESKEENENINENEKKELSPKKCKKMTKRDEQTQII